MPKGSYKTKIARNNAKLLIKKTGCDAVKIESNKNNFKIIKLLKNINACYGTYWIHLNLKKSLK